MLARVFKPPRNMVIDEDPTVSQAIAPLDLALLR